MAAKISKSGILIIIKKYSVKTAIILLLVIFIILLSVNFSSGFISTLSLAFTAIASIATIGTLVIALKLYDQYGLRTVHIQKQSDKLFELITFLKGKMFTATSNSMSYFIRLIPNQSTGFSELNCYSADAHKVIFICKSDYENFADSVLEIQRSIWLPEEIKNALNFFEIIAVTKDHYEKKEHILLSFKQSEQSEDPVRIYPDMTLSDFVRSVENLAIEIDNWVQLHSPVPLDLKLEVPEKRK